MPDHMTYAARREQILRQEKIYNEYVMKKIPPPPQSPNPLTYYQPYTYYEKYIMPFIE